MKIKVFPYSLISQGAKDIAQALDTKRIIPGGSYRPSIKTIVLNWGNSNPMFSTQNWINKPEAVSNATNKLKAFKVFKPNNISIPEFTTDKVVAQAWLVSKNKVVARHKLCGTNGEGIEIVKPGESLPNVQLYVKYQKKDKEFRVHVFNKKVIDITEKRRRSGFEGDRNAYVRNLANGWVFCRGDVNPIDEVKTEAIKAVSALGLDFGAVDVIQYSGKAYILEVNTAPGLEGMTLTRYVSAIKEFIQTKYSEVRKFERYQSRPNRYYHQ
jgi:glutathione synthase/RimK-type ligase-like ATP-grasp enzyme